MRRIPLLTMPFWLCALVFGQRFAFKNYTSEDGLPQLVVTCVFQDRDGFIWAGTQGGLVRFDGFRFESFGIRDGLSGDQIFCIGEDVFGRMYVGNRNGLSRFEDGQFNIIEAFRGMSVFDIVGTPSGQVIVATDVGLYVGNESFEPIDISLPEGRKVLLWTPELFLVGTLNGLFKVEGSGSSAVPAFDSDRIGAMLADGEDVLVSTQDGVWRWRNEQKVLLLEVETDTFGSVTSIQKDPLGELWIGTPTGLIWYGEKVRKITPSEGLPFSQVRSVLVDNSGLVWVGGFGGLSKFTGRMFEIYDAGHGLPSSNVRPITRDVEGELWVGTSNGMARFEDPSWKPIPFLAGKDQGRVFALTVGPAGKLWAAGTAGIFIWDGTSFDRFEPLPEGWGEVRALTFYSKELYFSTYRMGLFTWDGETINEIQVPGQRFLNPQLFVDKNQILWVSGENGLSCFDGTNWQTLNVEDGLPSDQVYFIAEDDKGHIWFNYANSFGLTRYDGETIQHFSQNDGLSVDTVYNIGFDSQGNGWFGTSRGLDRFDGNHFYTYQRLEGYPSFESNAGGFFEDTDQTLWFATAEGLGRYNPKYDLLREELPELKVCKVLVGNQLLNASQKTRIPGSESRLTIQALTLNYISGQTNRIGYMLEPLDFTWESFNGTLELNHLPAGDYKLSIGTLEGNANWQPKRVFDFQILPPLWQRFEFIIAAFFGLVCIIFLGFRLRTFSIQKRAVWLASEVADRTRDLENQRITLQQTLGELQRTRDEYHGVIENFVGPVWSVDRDLRLQLFNTSFREHMSYKGFLIKGGEPVLPLHGKESGVWQALYQKGLKGLRFSQILDSETSSGTQFLEFYFNPIFGQEESVVGVSCLCLDITHRKYAEQERELLHKQLTESARRAGMADVATSVLHNVGNVLNSMNVSTDILIQRLHHSPIPKLKAFVDLFKQHQHDIGTFMETTEKGRLVPKALKAFSEQLDNDRDSCLEELRQLSVNLDHVKSIIIMQQNYAKAAGHKETVDLVEVMEQALQINMPSLENYRVEILREYDPFPPLLTDKNAVLQILVNLISNAKNAMKTREGARQIVLRIRATKDKLPGVCLEVEDNGIGFDDEVAENLFTQGFSRMKGGHGFGLHSGAISAKNLGGSLTGTSLGPGKGAVFTLTLPAELPESQEAQSHSNMKI